MQVTSGRPLSDERNPYIDWARAVSVVIVVVFHTRLFTLARTGDGSLALVMWEPPSYLYVISWPLMAIPVFFVAGGYGHSVTMSRAARDGTGYAVFLAGRMRRLVGPTTVFIGVWAIVASVIAALTDVTVIAELTAAAMNLLWFITVYLVVTMVAPMMVRLHQRFGLGVFLVLGLLAIAIDIVSGVLGSVELRNLNLAPVWLFVHQLGIAYHHGAFRSWPAWTLIALGAGSVAAVAGLVGWFGYPPVSVGFASIPIANVQPPTFAMIPLAIGQVCGLAAFERVAPRWTRTPRLYGVVRGINALLMTVYLWHLPFIVLVNAAAWSSGLAERVGSGMLHLVVSVVSVALISVAATVIGRVDLAFVPPLGRDPSLSVTLIASITVTIGVALVWQSGLVVNALTPWSTLGIAAVMAGWWGVRIGAHGGLSHASRLDV
jgi:peptidoglycan/LPS O-acetylase OafA/YrhL